MDAVLERLGNAGVPMAVCTNKPEEPAREVLSLLGLETRFDTLIGGDTLPAKKPDPAPLREAARRLGQGRTVYVGDSEVDAETAARAGIPFALFTGGYRRSPVADIVHDARFDSFGELPAILDRLAPAAA